MGGREQPRCKMGWKNWPYWLKGGVIGGGIYIIWYIIQIGYTTLTANIRNPWINLPIYYTSFPVTSLNNYFMSLGFYYLMPFLLLIYYFLLGAIIGFIIDRIKGRKK